MRYFVLGGMGLALSVLAASANAQENSWRPVAPAPAAAWNSAAAPAVALQAPVPAVTLQAPVANPAQGGVLPVSYSESPGGFVARAKTMDAQQPLPVGPAIKQDTMPRSTPLKDGAMPPAAQETWGSTVSQWVTNGQEPGLPPGLVPQYGDGMMGHPGPIRHDGPMCHDDACCDGGGSCGACCPSGGSLWDRCCGMFSHARSACCADRSCDPCCDNCCPPRPCFWVRGEYLLWTVKAAPNPTLVTTNPNGAADPNFATAGTVAAFGGHGDDLNMRSGGRFTLGFELPCCCGWGFESTYFFLADRTRNATLSSDGSFSIGRPFIETNPAFYNINGVTQFVDPRRAELVAKAGIVAGTVSVDSTNEIWGVEANFRHSLCCGCNYKLDFIGGFRYLQLDESLGISENLTLLNAPALFGQNQISVRDSFLTRNEFYGGQVGLDGERRMGRWFVGGSAKVAMGSMHQIVDIDGQTTIGMSPTERGGLLTQPTNIGRYSRDMFAIVPEAGLKLGFYFTERLRGYVGYDVLYVSNVVRPGDQVDTFVNTSYLPPRSTPSSAIGAPTPRFQFQSTDFWAQGVNFGLEWKY